LNLHRHRKNTETLLDDIKEEGLQISAEKMKYIFMYCHLNAGHHNLVVANNSFENVVNSNKWERQ